MGAGHAQPPFQSFVRRVCADQVLKPKSIHDRALRAIQPDEYAIDDLDLISAKGECVGVEVVLRDFRVGRFQRPGPSWNSDINPGGDCVGQVMTVKSAREADGRARSPQSN